MSLAVIDPKTGQPKTPGGWADQNPGDDLWDYGVNGGFTTRPALWFGLLSLPFLIGMLFKTRFWEQLPVPARGGQSITDLPSGVGQCGAAPRMQPSAPAGCASSPGPSRTTTPRRCRYSAVRRMSFE